jgi:hypothetical protein
VNNEFPPGMVCGAFITSGEVHALIELSEQPSAPFAEISNTANRFNALLRDEALDIDRDEKRILAQRLRDVMVKRLREADATDCSRLAWLCVHLDELDAARAYVERGLERDPANTHCLRLADRLT